MNPCAQSLLNGIIDYAGLFPPARLPMGEALARFMMHRASNDGWMLARFVCPAARLGELEPFVEAADPTRLPIRVSVLGSGGDTLDSFIESVGREEAEFSAFAGRLEDRVVVDAFEVRLPKSGGAAVAVNEAWGRLTKNGSRPVTPFFEVSLLGEWRQRLPAAAAAVRDTGRAAGGGGRVGLKIRCGGLEANAIPEALAVAAAIATCRSTGIPLKATQGLHHPFRYHDPELDVMMHGFVNVFTASVLADVHDLPVTELVEIVADVDPSTFEIGPDALAWRGRGASAEEVTVARTRLLTSFGSCSFVEPRDDLRALGVLAKEPPRT
jgi:hypothetical protein